jgi:hypothetical protein
MDPKVSIIIALAVALGVAAYVLLCPTTEAPQSPAPPPATSEPAQPK